MKNLKKQIIATHILPEGITIDIKEGWKKLNSSQFGGSPARAFPELIQNSIDSYPNEVPMDQRLGKIKTSKYTISIEDYGVGLSREKLSLLMTLGGTDKSNDPGKIGRFGIGFFSIFNQALGTSKVIVETNCEGQAVKLTFTVTEPDYPPEISVDFPGYKLSYSTKISVTFDRHRSVRDCVRAATKSLKYYPCKMAINGQLHESVWQKAFDSGIQIREEGAIRGFLESNHFGYSAHAVTMMCKYEYLGTNNLYHFIKGGRNLSNDLRDFYSKATPFLPGYSVTVNSNDLSLTISRDSYFLDYKFERVVEFINSMYLDKLAEVITPYNKQLVLANQYIYRHKLRAYLDSADAITKYSSSLQKVIKVLCQAKVFPVKDQSDNFSLTDIKEMVSEGLPVFFSPDSINENWLGGRFKHDFVLLPSACSYYHGAPDFYKDLLNSCFGEAIDLDSIQEYPHLIKSLVERKLIDKSLLSPKCDFLGETQLDDLQAQFILEINALLSSPEIIRVVSHNLRIPIGKIQALFFEIKEEGFYLATGLFHENGIPVSDDYVSNFEKDSESKEQILAGIPRDVVLGLSLNHPFIQYILDSDNKFRALYALTYLAAELASCQKILVPYSPFYHLVKEKLAAGMRRVLIDQLCEGIG